MVVMNKLPANKIAVVLVNNIPPQTTDGQIADFFTDINDVSSLQFIDGEGSGNYERSCWIHVLNPAEAITKINVATIAGKKLRARLMGYLFKV
jgi:hypothetical protein